MWAVLIIVVFFSFPFFCPSYAPAAEKLGFKGLNLGMTYQEVNQLVATDFNTWRFSFEEKEFSSKVNQGYLSFENWNGIGCEGPPGKQFCHRISSVWVEFFKGRVLLIDILSLPFSADRLESELKEWLNFAHKGLAEKYGAPRIIKQIDPLNILWFKSRIIIYLSEWKRGQNSISLSAVEVGSHFYSFIRFIDQKAKKEEEIITKRKPEF